MKSSNPRASGDLAKQGSGGSNAELLKWWGGMLESLGEDSMDKALEYSASADDTLGQVRVMCFSQKYDAAKALVDDSGDRAAACVNPLC